MSGYRLTLKRKRNKRLASEGFLGFERLGGKAQKGLITVAFSHTPWFRKLRRERLREYRSFKAGKEGWSKGRLLREWQARILQRYKRLGWRLADGSPDVWRMLRTEKKRIIGDSPWLETPDKWKGYRGTSSHRKGLDIFDKGQIREQRARYREKQKVR